MQKKIILLTTFVNPSYLENFLNMLEKRHSIKRESVFIFETLGEDLILTFKIYFLTFQLCVNRNKLIGGTHDARKN